MTYTKTILPNGLRLILVPMKENKTVTAMVLVEAGSRYEDKEVNGISHFLEHMCFKGTLKRPSALQIASDFERLGAQYNAFTSGTYTGYYGKVASSKSIEMLEMVSDLYLNPTLPESEIEKEKGVVIEEMNMNRDRPQRIVWDVLDELVYGDHPLGRTVIGTKETVSNLTHESLTTYRSNHYIPQKTVVVVSGGFDTDRVVDYVQNTFGKLPTSEVIAMSQAPATQTSPRLKVLHKDTDQTHFVLSFRSFGMHDPRIYAGSLLRTILGGGMSSRLFYRIREELGLCYYVFASMKLESDCGLFTISAGVSNDKLEIALNEIINELHRFLAEGPTEDEVQKAKDYRIGSTYLDLETSNDLADWYGFQEIDREDIRKPEDYEKNLSAVSLEDVRRLARELFTPENAKLAVVGPQSSEAELEAIIARC